MTRSLIPAVIMALAFTLSIVSFPLTAGQQEKATQKKDAKSAPTSMTGCVDQRDGQYVLTDDRELKPIANLEADGFPQEGFAKHLGHKVTVSGTSNSADPRPTFKVRSITTVSESCTPQPR